jgi:hypothetical protein
MLLLWSYAQQKITNVMFSSISTLRPRLHFHHVDSVNAALEAERTILFLEHSAKWLDSCPCHLLRHKTTVAGSIRIRKFPHENVCAPFTSPYAHRDIERPEHIVATHVTINDMTIFDKIFRAPDEVTER